MKNYTIYKIVIMVFIIPLIGFANPNPPKGRYEKDKTIKKEYAVNANALLEIHNKYGDVDVMSWNENRVLIEVNIIVDGNNEDKVRAKLDQIDVEFEDSKSRVSARTVIEKKSSGWFNSGNSNVNFQINYKVKVPVTNNVDLNNDYGSIALNELKGKADISCDYGKIIVGSLFHPNNSINIDYTNNSTIDFMNEGSINADYSNLTVEKAKKIDLNADYTDMVFENIENLSFNCDYGNIKVGNGNSIEGNGDYLTMKFGTVFKKLIVDADYGSIRIDKLMNGFDLVEVSSDYTGIKIGVQPDAVFDFEVKLSYGELNIDDDNATFIKKIVKSTSKYYEGYMNSDGSNSMISIESEYGSVKIDNF